MMLKYNGSDIYPAFTPTIYQGRVYYANPVNPPSAGESPGSYPEKWLNAAGDVVYMAPADGNLYGMKDRMWSQVVQGGGGSDMGDAIKALKFYSKNTIMFTNARIVDRRKEGWDFPTCRHPIKFITLIRTTMIRIRKAESR
jgi:hypothetical protein